MSRTIIIISLFFLQQMLHAQAIIKDPVLQIPENLTYSANGISSFIKEHYQSDTARIRAIFVWVANNINYDIERFQKKTPGLQPVADVLKTRLAVCRGYADLFSELSNQCNVPSAVIGGYTKQKGVISNISHAWVAAELDHKWWLFDPTWAAGYVRDNKFTKGYSDTFYKLTPDMMIKDHMPFDPLYQFLDHTLTNKDFIEGKTPAGKAIFNYADTLQKLSLLSKEDKIRNELRRVQNNGIENDAIKGYYDLLAKQTEGFSSKNSFEQAISLYNRSIALFNLYLSHKNKQFTSVEANDLKTMVDSISYQVNASYNMLGSAVARDETNRQALAKTYQELERFHNRVNQEKEFVTTYLNTDVSSRKQLFYKK